MDEPNVRLYHLGPDLISPGQAGRRDEVRAFVEQVLLIVGEPRPPLQPGELVADVIPVARLGREDHVSLPFRPSTNVLIDPTVARPANRLSRQWRPPASPNPPRSQAHP